MKPLRLPVNRMSKEAELPHYAYAGDAGLDLASTIDLDIAPFERRMISTGIRVAIPGRLCGVSASKKWPRHKERFDPRKRTGLIDSHYRGEIIVSSINLDPQDTVHISSGERIAQLVIIATPAVEVSDVPELDMTDRGVRGFGSSD